MKSPIVFEVYKVSPEGILVGRITGSNIHIGDVFSLGRIRRTIGKVDGEFQYELTELFRAQEIEVLSIEAYGREIDWLPAPYGAEIKINAQFATLFAEHVKGFNVTSGVVELIGLCSRKSDIGGGYNTSS